MYRREEIFKCQGVSQGFCGCDNKDSRSVSICNIYHRHQLWLHSRYFNTFANVSKGINLIFFFIKMTFIIIYLKYLHKFLMLFLQSKLLICYFIVSCLLTFVLFPFQSLKTIFSWYNIESLDKQADSSICEPFKMEMYVVIFVKNLAL